MIAEYSDEASFSEHKAAWFSSAVKVLATSICM